MNDDERTNALGLFNTARSYWRSAEQLNANPPTPKVTHPQAPVTFLFCHAIELYLKAYLRGANRSIADLKKVGHRIAALADAAVAQGLTIRSDQKEIISHLDDFDAAIEARYIRTGFKELPTNKALSATAAHLDQIVCSALADKGIPVRRESFEKPAAKNSVELDPETIVILLHLFRAETEQERNADNMARMFDLERNVLQYELDNLQSAGFVEQTDYDPVWGTVFWGLTRIGRKYVIQNKLHKLEG